MSLILDALNRADRERSRQRQQPNLHPAPMAARGGRSSVLGGILVIALVIAMAVIAVQRYPGADTPTTAAPPDSPAPSAGDPAESLSPTVPAEPPPPTAAPSDAPPKSDADDIAALYRQSRTGPDDESGATGPAPSSPTADKTVSQPAATDAEPTPAKVEAKPSGEAILRQIPLLNTLSTRFQRSVPNIEYSLHVYNDDDGKGMVRLNGAVRRVGDEIEPGLRLIAILPDSAVLDYNGTQFRLTALNSWLNFQ